MISIVTGTLDRLQFLPDFIDNTVNSCDKIELVLVDGGSIDGTIEYIEKLNHPQIKLIKVGKRSPYPHYMNLGIRNTKYENILQYNDDNILCSKWEDIIKELEENPSIDIFNFNWKYGYKEDIKNEQWLLVPDNWTQKSWINEWRGQDECINFGIYRKEVFRKCGLYNNAYQYYHCDSDMTQRAIKFGFKFKMCKNIKVLCLVSPKKAIEFKEDWNTFARFENLYSRKIFNDPNIERL
jgi:GT2 family glycosyltransferase